jgi:hypothetical protein
MKLSPHFSLAELVKSQSASRHGISNNPGEVETQALKDICEDILEPLRSDMGFPIFISSGFRSTTLNRKIGGSTTSQHCKGEAVDIDNDGKNAEIFHWILENADFDQLIWEFGNASEPDWVHVSYVKGRKNRGQILRAKRVNGKTVYEKF